MASVNDLWLTDFGDPFPGEPAFHRPAIVVGPPDYFGAGFPFVFVVPLTSKDRGLDLHVEIEANEATGLEVASYAQCELLRSVNRRRLMRQLGTTESGTSIEISEILGTLLNLQ